MEITAEDKKMVKALVHAVENGAFSIKGREGIAFGLIMKWLYDLNQRMDKAANGNNKRK